MWLQRFEERREEQWREQCSEHLAHLQRVTSAWSSPVQRILASGSMSMRSGNTKRLTGGCLLCFMDVRESLLVALRGSEAVFDRTPSNDLTGEFADCCALWL